MSAFSAAAQDEDGDIIKTLQARVADLEAQLYAVGAGGVGKLEQPQSVTDCHQSQPKGEPPGSTESAYQRGYLDGMAKGRRDAALDAAEQQPVAWLLRDANNHKVWFLEKTGTPTGYRGEWIKTPLYARPQPKREPLTDERIREIGQTYTDESWIDEGWSYSFARAIEAAHGVKGRK